MKLALLDTVVLKRDLPEHGLRAGDLGAVVELYGTDGVEVEFVRASGQTKALVTLKAADVRCAGDGDMLGRGISTPGRSCGSGPRVTARAIYSGPSLPERAGGS